MKQQFTFPGGRRRHVAVPDTAGNVQRTLTPGSGKRWKILGLRLKLVAVGAANRQFEVRFTDGTNDTIDFPTHATAITAGQTKYVCWFPHAARGYGDALPTDVVAILTLPEWILEGADEITVDVLNGLAADTFSGTLLVLETGL